MRNKRKIILSIVLLAIIITGIFFLIRNKGREDENINSVLEESIEVDENNKFYYVEEFISENISDSYDKFFKYDNRIVRIINSDEAYLQDLKSKENIFRFQNEEDVLMANGFWIHKEMFWNIKYDSQSKNVVVKSFDYEGNEKEQIVLKDFKGEISDDGYIDIEDIKVTDNYIYLITYNDSRPQSPILQIFTKTGELKITYDDVVSFDVDSKGRYIYTVDSLNFRGFFMIDSESGNEIFRNTDNILEPIRFSWDGNLIYGFDIMDGNIKAFDEKGHMVKESVLKFGEDTTYLLDDYYVENFAFGEDDEIYCILKTKVKKDQDIALKDIKSLCYSYTKQEGERAKRETTVIVTAPYRNDFTENAIKRYELKYPDEHIEYSYAYNTFESFLDDGEEYGKKMTLDIINGDIGDVVQTGGAGIEIHNILSTDVFMDLKDLIERDKNYKDLNKEVLNALKINNTIRGLPINYMFYQYELNEDLEKQLGLNIDFENISWSEILDIVKIIEEKTSDGHLFTDFTQEQSKWRHFGEHILIANMPDLINLETKEVDLNQEWFSDLLIKFKEYSKSERFLSSNEEGNLQGALLRPTLYRDGYLGDKLVRFDEYNKTNKSRMISNFTGEKNDNRIGYSTRMYSINNRSERTENAWKFLSFLLEEDIQFIASKDRTGIPLSKKGVDRMISDAVSSQGLKGENIDKYNNAMIESSHKIDYLYNMGYLMNDLLDPIELYMEDTITLDEALKKAEENVIIRLNE